MEMSTDISAVRCWIHCLCKKVAKENVRTYESSGCMSECPSPLDVYKGTLNGTVIVRSRLVVMQVAWGTRKDCFAVTPILCCVRLMSSFESTLYRERKSRLYRLDVSVTLFHALLDETIWMDPPSWEEDEHGVVE